MTGQKKVKNFRKIPMRRHERQVEQALWVNSHVGGVPDAVLVTMSIIQLDTFRQAKQRQYMKRYRTRLEHFIKIRVPQNSSNEILEMAHHKLSQDSTPEMVWDYVEMREIMLDFIETHVAKEIYAELQKQFWFDEAFISKDLVAEKCLSFMILGPTAAAQ